MIPASVGQYIILPLIQISVIIGAIAGCVAYLTLAERKIIAWMQVRIGPHRVGPRGLLQPIADGIKLILKEDLIPAGADKLLFIASPLAVVAVAFTAFMAAPFGPEEKITTDLFGLFSAPVTFVPWVVSNVNLGILFILAVSSLSVYGIILAGWSSNSKYSLLGSLRSASQVISYEVALALALIGPIMIAGSLRLQDIVEAQRNLGLWFVVPQIAAFVIYLIAIIAETNRAPFDMAEAETELVAGFHTEYSGMKFALFFMAEYAAMILVSLIASVVFLGGWLPFIPFVGWEIDAWLRSLPVVGMFTPLFWLVPKVLFVLYFYLWIRATWPRYRYDQLMGIGWKILIPAALANILATGLARLWLGA